MKNRKINFLKLGILLFGVSLLFWNCEKDFENLNSTKEKLSISKPRIETFTLEQIEKDNTFKKLKNNFKILQNNIASRNEDNNSYNPLLVDTLGITIDANTIRRISYDNYVSFTMLMIEPNNTSQNFSNLVILEKDGINRIFTVRYFQNQSRGTSNGSEVFGDIQMFSGIHQLEDDVDSSGGGNGGNTGCDEYVNVCNTLDVWSSICGCPAQHLPGEYCTCTNQRIDILVAQQEVCEDVCVTDNYNDPTGDNNTSTGSGGTGNPNDNLDPTDVDTSPVLPEDPKCPTGSGKIFNEVTEICECPDGYEENDAGVCVVEEDCDTSKEDLKKVFPNISDSDAELLASVINDKGIDFGIDSDEDLWHFLSQAGHETGGFNTLNVTESTYWTTASKLANTYKKFTIDSTLAANNSNKYYAPDYLRNSSGVANVAMCCKYGNGDLASGDGYKYRGRGLFQLTWKDNYSAFKTWYNNKYNPDIDPVTSPNIIATNDTLAILSGLWYYKTRVVDKITIDSTTTVSKVTKPINQAKKGLKDRKQRFQKAKDSINCL